MLKTSKTIESIIRPKKAELDLIVIAIRRLIMIIVIAVMILIRSLFLRNSIRLPHHLFKSLK